MLIFRFNCSTDDDDDNADRVALEVSAVVDFRHRITMIIFGWSHWSAVAAAATAKRHLPAAASSTIFIFFFFTYYYCYYCCSGRRRRSHSVSCTHSLTRSLALAPSCSRTTVTARQAAPLRHSSVYLCATPPSPPPTDDGDPISYHTRTRKHTFAYPHTHGGGGASLVFVRESEKSLLLFVIIIITVVIVHGFSAAEISPPRYVVRIRTL